MQEQYIHWLKNDRKDDAAFVAVLDGLLEAPDDAERRSAATAAVIALDPVDEAPLSHLVPTALLALGEADAFRSWVLAHIDRCPIVLQPLPDSGVDLAPGLETFGELLQRNDEDLVVHVVRCIQKIGAPAAKFAPRLRELRYLSMDAMFQTEITQAMARMGVPDDSAVGELMEHARQTRNKDLRCEALQTMAELGAGAQPAVPMLLRLLDDKDLVVANLATYALTRSGAPEAADALATALLDESDSDRYAAILQCLGEIDPWSESAHNAVQNALDGKDLLKRAHAAVALFMARGARGPVEEALADANTRPDVEMLLAAWCPGRW